MIKSTWLYFILVMALPLSSMSATVELLTVPGWHCVHPDGTIIASNAKIKTVRQACKSEANNNPGVDYSLEKIFSVMKDGEPPPPPPPPPTSGSYIGIPDIPFSWDALIPSLPADWTSDVPGFYYVNRQTGNSSGNGNPTNPKNFIPSPVPAGSVVVVAGVYNHSTTRTFNCTESDPCFLISDPNNPAVSMNELTINGSYYIIDGITFSLASNVSGKPLGMSGDHGALRNSTVTGTLTHGGMFTTGTGPLAIMGNQIIDNGDVNASNDQDQHGIKVVSSNVWILNNELARNSGDGIQVGDTGTINSVHHVYVGGNVSHDNKQTGFWHKTGHDIIFSQNVAYGHVPSGSSDGEGFGGQLDANFVWYLFNESYNNYGGMGEKSSGSGGSSNHDYYFIGNVIHDNIDPTFDTGNVWEISSIYSWNKADITIVNNTIDKNSGGINLNGNTGPAYIYNNVIQNVQTSVAPINAGDPGDIQFEEFNAFDGDPVTDVGMSPLPAKDPYAIFESRYGMSIQVDFDKKSRPINQWDIGAFEN